jgi:predicted CoA-binding protein
MNATMDAEAVQPEKHLLIYGLSREGNGFAYSVLERIRTFQPDLHLTAVHPEVGELPAAGLSVIASARDAVPPATRAMLVLNAEDTREALNDVAAAGIKHVWLVMYADTRENLRFAREQGMQVVSGCPVMNTPRDPDAPNVRPDIARYYGRE